MTPRSATPLDVVAKSSARQSRQQTDVRPVHEATPGVTETARTLRLERRSDGRQGAAAGRFEPLWLSCKGGAMGGQVSIGDLSARGIGVIVSHAAVRLIAALQEAQETGAVIDVARTPCARGGRAHVVWHLRTEARDLRFGLELSEPLADWLESGIV
jgi:hypothetical protein